MANRTEKISYFLLWLSLLALSFEDGGGFSFGRLATVRSPLLSALHGSSADCHETSSSTSDEDDITEVTITVPRHYEGEVEKGSYPSPLHSIHVESLLLPEEAANCRDLAKMYAAESGAWEKPDSKRHQTYATCDFPIDECESLSAYLEEIGFHEEILTRLSDHYNVDMEDMTYLDFFCAHYQAQGNDEGAQPTMDRLEAHRDGSLLSFTVLLTPPDEFEGGGTFFDALRDVDASESEALYPNGVIRLPQAGDCVLHSGKLLHGADVVTSGERTVLVGFIEVAEWCQRPDVLAEACTNFGRMDVATYRYKRQQEKTAKNRRGWILNNSRWLPDSNADTGQGRSYIRGFCPIFTSVAARANPEYQRRKKLEAEDVLLRSILLPEKLSVISFSDEEITIL